MEAIKATWLENRPRDMLPYLHPDITLAFPGFGAMVRGRDLLVTTFVQFCNVARVVEYRESDLDVQVIGDTAVVTYRFDMIYEREKKREHSTGRDLWVFARHGDQWLAVWRTMLDVAEGAVH